jgi:hypothetical protein
MATNFSAVLAPPSGLATTGVNFQLRSGKVLQVDGSNHSTVSSQSDMKSLVDQGWTVVSVTQATAGGNQG